MVEFLTNGILLREGPLLFRFSSVSFSGLGLYYFMVALDKGEKR